jgi:methyl-accepting chemotaxis protein
MHSLQQPAPPSMAPPIRQHADAPAFFHHQGVMALGILAFRRISFPAKLAWVTASLLLPLLVLSGSLWQAASKNISFSAKERLGISYARTLMPLLSAAQNQRRAAAAQAADLLDASQKVALALQSVASVEQSLGPQLGTAALWQALHQQQQAVAAQPVRADTSATFAAHTALINSALALLSGVADNSNLKLDPDINTFYLMDATVMQQPLLIEQLGQMRGMGNALIRAGTATQAQHDKMTQAYAFAQAFQDNVDQAHAHATHADVTLAGEINATQAATSSLAFLELVKHQVLAEQPSGDPQAFVTAGNQAIGQHYQAVNRGFDALDKRLATRVNSLQQTLYTQLGVAVLGIALALYMLVAFYRVTQGGISEIARQLDEISRGNLGLRPQPWGRDEIAALMTTLGRTLEALRRTVRQVRTGAGEVHLASQEVATAAQDLSRRTEQAASLLQRTSAAMTQIGSTLQDTAHTAAGASDLVVRNAEVATQGGAEVGQVVSTMGEIKSSSTRIEDIIGTIDSIAFQTNILALNAAVEAARAGEQGRGFAVVASEVRALAQRSAGAAREIKSLIGTSVSQVESGSRVVAQAGDTMRQIVDNADLVKQLMGDISGSTQQQVAGLHEVGQSVRQIDAMTQQNAAMVEQTAAAAASLKDSAQRMNASMAFFQGA